MSVIQSDLLLGQEGGAGYQISRSLRFSSTDSAYCGRTVSSANTSNTTATLSWWVKRSSLGANGCMFSGYDGTSTYASYIQFDAADTLTITNPTYNTALTTTQVFRDASAWYNFVFVWDTSNATSTDRYKLYVNGSRITTFSTAVYPSLNDTGRFIYANANNRIGTTWGSTGYSYFSGYLADIHFIDGQALIPSSFGQTDDNGIWRPKAYGGSYGANGFKLDFSDNSTAAALGTDTSGNGNTWTVLNISVTAGAGNDSLVDSPTNYGTDTGVGGEVRGSYCILNPTATASSSYGRAIAQNGGLELTESSGRGGAGTIAMTSGKWYAEVVFAVAVSSAPNEYPLCGVCRADYASSSLATFPGYDADGVGIDYTGKVRNQGVISATYTAFSSTNICMIAYDADTGKVWFGRNGVWFASGNPAAGTNPIATAAWFASGAYFCCNSFSTSRAVWNFGQRPFSYTAPSGFKALCTQNLPDSGTITTSGTFTGNGVADGPFVYLNGVPTAMTINGQVVTFGTHADKLSNGFKVRTADINYNQNAASRSYTVTTTGAKFKNARAQSNT